MFSSWNITVCEIKFFPKIISIFLNNILCKICSTFKNSLLYPDVRLENK
jgi:hypothetical protein